MSGNALPNEHCCICGSEKGVSYCGLCGHNFCDSHRRFWHAIGVWQRGVAAVKAWIGDYSGTPHCAGHLYPPSVQSPRP